MRHGYVWWEAFDRYLQEILKEKGEFFRLSWYKTRKKDFGKLWREGKITVPPKRRG